MITAGVIIYALGWAIMSLFGAFAWIMGLGFNQDNMNTFFYEQCKLTVTVFCLIWFWPIAVPIGMYVQASEEKRWQKANEKYRKEQNEKIWKD